MEHEHEIIRPSNILIKPSWGKQLKYLSVKDKAAVFTNLFNLYNGEPLENMTPIAAMFFSNLEEVMEYNATQYQKTVERNRENGRKNKGKSVEKPTETQENPVGTVGYPNNPKDKARDKSKDKPEEKGKEIDKSKAALNQAQLEKLEQQFLQLVNQTWSHVQDKEEANFIHSCQLLAEELSWERFKYLMLQASKEEVKQIVTLFNISLSPAEILELRRHTYYYLNKLIPQLP